MRFGDPQERRTEKEHNLRPRRSFLFHPPRPFSLFFLATGTALAAIADVSSPPSVWLGPVYLCLVAFAAWTTSGLVAVALGIGIITITALTGGMIFYPFGPQFAITNLALRCLCVLLITGFLTVARRSCEHEWKLARTDPLTGALNRQAFFEVIGTLRYDDHWCALAYADLDGLKRLNDETGHQEGDKGIKAFASIVRKEIRKGDIFARLGGDEFVVFMKIKNLDAGRKMASRLLGAVKVDSSNTGSALPSSWGILFLPPGNRNIDHELKAADELMYRRKRREDGFGVAIYNMNDGSCEPIRVNENQRSVIRSQDRLAELT